MNLKTRITDYVNFIEAANKEIKAHQQSMNSLVQEIKASKDKEEQTDLTTEHFVHWNIAAMIAKDMRATMDKLTEAYTIAKTSKDKIEFSDEEEKILEAYLQESNPAFVLAKGKIVSKETGLVELMNTKAVALRETVTIQGLLKSILDLKNDTKKD